MSLVGRFTRAIGAFIAKDGIPVSAPPPASWLAPYASAAGTIVTQATALALSQVYSGTMSRASDVARCTPRLLRADGPRNETPITDHPVAKLLKRPNWIQTQFEFVLQMHAAYCLKQNAYAAVIRDNRGKPLWMIPVNPDAVMMLEAADGSIFYNVNRLGLFQIAALRNFPSAVPAEDMFHLRGLAPNMLLGIPTIAVARDAIGVALGLEQQAARFMAAGARPSGVLTVTKALGDAAVKRLRDQWEAFRAGLQNVGRTAILEEGVDWKPIQLSSVDLEFIAQRKFSVDEIGRFLRVPNYKLGGDYPRGVALDDLEQVYVNSTIMPDLEAWEQKFEQYFDLDKEGLSVDFDERNLLRAAESVRINNQRLKVMSGLATQNECRAEEGMPAVDGGDVLLRPVNLAAIGSDLTGTAPDGAGRPVEGNLPDPGAGNAASAGKKIKIVEYPVETQTAFVKAALNGERNRRMDTNP